MVWSRDAPMTAQYCVSTHTGVVIMYRCNPSILFFFIFIFFLTKKPLLLALVLVVSSASAVFFFI